MKRLSVKKTITLCAVSGVLIACIVVSAVLTTVYKQAISDYFGQETSRIVNPGDPIYTSDFSSDAKRRIHAEAVCRDIEAEGIVLLENGDVQTENGSAPSLPLAKRARVSVFGVGARDFLYGGTVSDTASVSDPVTFYRALEESGFYINPTLRDFYSSGAGRNYGRKVTQYPADLDIGEVPVGEYFADGGLAASYNEYSDAAIVVIGRSGLDGYDVPQEMRDYRALDDNELALLSYVNDRFDNVVLVINSAEPMMIGEAEADSVLWVGNPGTTGARAIGYVLNGYVSPSGRLTDTWAYDHSSAPSSVNTGTFRFNWSVSGAPNADDSDYYVALAEGVYVGYRYYETRYEDYVLEAGSPGEYDYGQTVIYPFGHGLSYTEFEYSAVNVTPSDDGYVVSLIVTNVGSAAGKEVVQIYMQAPYDAESGVERPSVELVGFAKTETLQPGGGEDGRAAVTINVPRSVLEVYDSSARGGEGAHVVQSGEYYFTAASDAHAAVGNILAYKAANGAEFDASRADGSYAEADASLVGSVTIAGDAEDTDAPTDALAEQADGDTESGGESAPQEPKEGNKFAAADIRTYDESFSYLSRSDWAGTYPTEAYAGGSWLASAELAKSMAADTSYLESGAAGADSVAPAGDLKAFDLIEAEYGDERFSELAAMMSRSEKAEFVHMGGYTINGVEKISMPSASCRDGATGVSGAGVGSYSPETSYPTPSVVAATWNTERAEQLGVCLSEDSLGLDVSGVFLQSFGLRRSLNAGGGHKSFGEDPLLSGVIGAAEVRGIRTKMSFAVIGDLAFSVQLDHARGLAVFGSEQAFRDIYLRPFEIAVKEGGAGAVIQSASRVGTRWVGAHSGLMSDILRGEWGFEGMTMTSRDSRGGLTDIASGLCAGTDMWFNSNAAMFLLTGEQLGCSAVADSLARAAYNVIYTVVTSNAMNGMTEDSGVEEGIIPPWQIVYIVIVAIVAAGVVAMLLIVVINRIATRKKHPETTITVG